MENRFLLFAPVDFRRKPEPYPALKYSLITTLVFVLSLLLLLVVVVVVVVVLSVYMHEVLLVALLLSSLSLSLSLLLVVLLSLSLLLTCMKPAPGAPRSMGCNMTKHTNRIIINIT